MTPKPIKVGQGDLRGSQKNPKDFFENPSGPQDPHLLVEKSLAGLIYLYQPVAK